MVFSPPRWVPDLDVEAVPDSISISQFMLDEAFGRCCLDKSKSPFVCGLSDVQYSAQEVKERVDSLARGLGKELGWSPNKDSEWDKVITIFAHNTVSL
jgi:ribosome assembly protein SQT1